MYSIMKKDGGKFLGDSEQKINQDIKIWDTTLRDGEQTPGVVFSLEEKIELAHIFNEFGVDMIALMPGISESEAKLTKRLANSGMRSGISALTMMRKDSIDLSIECGVQQIKLLTSLSDTHLQTKLKISREENIERSLKWIEYCREQGAKGITLAGEDYGRADMNYVIELGKAIDGKVDFFLPCDTVGRLTPFETFETINSLKKEYNGKIGLHIHNDLGQATANTLAGLSAGAEMFSGTFTGLGERAGNVAIEEVVMALRHQYGRELGVEYEMIWDICELVQKYSNVYLQQHKAVSGKNAYRHEAGIHVDGMIKNPENYELYNPEEVGSKRRFLFGKHSGTKGLKYIFDGAFPEERILEILAEIKRRSSKEKRAFTEDEVKNFFLR